MSDYTNVMDYAIGDGVTDDTDAINQADADAHAAGVALYFPPATYVATRLTHTAKWVGEDAVILRKPATPAGALVVMSSTLRMRGITLDGNKGSQTEGCNLINALEPLTLIQLDGVTARNAKSVSGAWGSGIAVRQKGQNFLSYIRNCDVYDNDGTGCAVNQGLGMAIARNRFYRNGQTGLEVNNYDQTFVQKTNLMTITENRSYLNGQNGFVIGNFIGNNNTSMPVYNHDNIEANVLVLSQNIANDNNWYGFAISGFEVCVTGNTARNNALTQPTFGGFLFNALNSVLSSNIASSNAGMGIDIGAAKNCIVSANSVWSNASVGINCEGNVRVTVSGNHVGANDNVTNGKQIIVERYSAGDVLSGFFAVTDGVDVSDNFIYVDCTREGIRVDSNPSKCSIRRNKFYCENPATDVDRCILAFATDIDIKDNVVLNPGHELVSLAGGALNVPDVLDFVITNSSTAISAFQTRSQSIVGYGVAFASLISGGSGYTSQPAVSFVGGGGSGAAGYALISKTGQVTGVRVTAHGSGYASAPTVVFTGGGGSGASAVAQHRLPPPKNREITIFANQPQTLSSAGWWQVAKPGGGDLLIPSNGVATLLAYYNRWNLKSKNF